MPDLTVSADIDAFLASANDAAARTELGLTALATTTPGTGVATALAANIGSAGAPVLFNGAGGTPTSIVLTNASGTAASLTAGTASAVAVGGITGLGANVATFLATPSSANLRSAVTDESGTGALLFANGALGTPASGVGTNLTGIPISTGLTGAGTGVLAALAVNANAGGGLIVLADPGADRIPFWDDSAGAYVFLTVGTGLQITGTTIEATGAGGTAVTAASAAAGAGLLWTSGGADRTAVATDTVGTINATNATVTNFLPVANDGAAIGASGTAFSDLFLASGAVINFNAGNLTLTHSAGTLTSNGAYVGTTATLGSTTSLLLGTAGSAVGNIGFRNGTSGTITLAPTTGALGTVTQTLQAVTGTILCTGGTDVPVADGGTGLSSGTSGGVLGFTASGTIASSAALAANAIVIGGGAGATPTTTTTGTGVLTQLGLAADGSDVDAIGFRGVPINSQSAAYTTVMADNGKTILHPTADNNARTFTIAANASVAYELGTTITFINQINTVTIAINSDTLVLAGAGTTGSRTLAANGIATAVKIASTTWIINGTGLT